MMHYGEWGPYGMHTFWWIFWVAIIVLVLLFIWLVPKSQVNDHHESPLEILQKRYARGEISTTEYEERKVRLQKDMGLPSHA